MRLATLVSSILLMGTVAVAQCTSLTTLTTSGNGQSGTMFDIVNISATPILITGFHQGFFAGAADDIEIRTKSGTWNGFEQTPAAWTLVGSATAVPHTLAPTLDPLPITLSVIVPPGATQAFYITTTAGTVAYTTGIAQLNAVIGSDANIEVRAGVGVTYPFGTSYGLPTDGRLWNGSVDYCVVNGTAGSNTPLGAGCVRQYGSFYQLFANAAVASTALTGNSLLLVPTANGYQGTWLPGSASAFFVPPVAPTTLTPGDDGTVTYALTSGTFLTPQGPQTSLQVNGNGIIAWGGTLDFPGTNAYTPTAPGFLNSASGGIYAWHDYNATEAGSGPIVAEEAGGILYVTWNGVENYSATVMPNPSTLQFQLDLASGLVTIVFVSIDSNTTSTWGTAHLIGYSSPGVSADPGAIDLALATPAELLVADPEITPLLLTATTRPVIGTSWNLTLSNVPATGVLGVDVFGLADPGLDDLFFLGMPGCGLRSTLDITGAWLVSGSTHNYSLVLPNDPSFINLHIFTTSAVFQVPPINTFGAITANGIDGLVGDV